jgi:hypothetical protein
MQTSVDTKPGLKLRGTTCSTEVVVVRPAAGPVQLTCCGAPLTTEETGIAPSGPTPDGVLLGKRYADEETGLELLCTKPGPGELAVDSRPLLLKGAKPLPSSD